MFSHPQSLASKLRLAKLTSLSALVASSAAFVVASGHARPTARVVELTLTAAPSRLSLVPGESTDVFAYNDLPEATTIHWHGLHIPAAMDGSPLEPVKPGGTFDYIFDVLPGSAGTYWYHPHPDRDAGYQVAKGLYGAIIIRAAGDPLAAIPEKLLVLSDNRFLPGGNLDLPPPDSPQGEIDEENGREGPVLFVNGQIMPTISIRSGEVQRWRVVNASAAREYRLALTGREFLQVGTDGGLFERPVP